MTYETIKQKLARLIYLHFSLQHAKTKTELDQFYHWLIIEENVLSAREKCQLLLICHDNVSLRTLYLNNADKFQYKTEVLALLKNALRESIAFELMHNDPSAFIDQLIACLPQIKIMLTMLPAQYFDQDLTFLAAIIEIHTILVSVGKFIQSTKNNSDNLDDQLKQHMTIIRQAQLKALALKPVNESVSDRLNCLVSLMFASLLEHLNVKEKDQKCFVDVHTLKIIASHCVFLQLNPDDNLLFYKRIFPYLLSHAGHLLRIYSDVNDALYNDYFETAWGGGYLTPDYIADTALAELLSIMTSAPIEHPLIYDGAAAIYLAVYKSNFYYLNCVACSTLNQILFLVDNYIGKIEKPQEDEKFWEYIKSAFIIDNSIASLVKTRDALVKRRDDLVQLINRLHNARIKRDHDSLLAISSDALVPPAVRSVVATSFASVSGASSPAFFRSAAAATTSLPIPAAKNDAEANQFAP